MKESQDARSSPANCRRPLTNPTESVSPFCSAIRPSVADAATPPRAPINQTPIRDEGMMVGAQAAGELCRGSGTHSLSAAEQGHLEPNSVASMIVPRAETVRQVATL